VCGAARPQDCEGCEVDFFRSLLDSGQQHLLPDQIAIELHYPYEPRNTSIWFKRFSDLFRWPAEQMADEMYRKAGFAALGHVRGDVRCCQEVLLARTKCV